MRKCCVVGCRLCRTNLIVSWRRTQATERTVSHFRLRKGTQSAVVVWIKYVRKKENLIITEETAVWELHFDPKFTWGLDEQPRRTSTLDSYIYIYIYIYLWAQRPQCSTFDQNFNFLFKKGSSKKISYERRAYESVVDEKSLSWAIFH